MNIKVSVCIAWYNRSDQIKKSIESIVFSNIKYLELIIVNDGSTDPLVKERLDEYLVHDNIKVIHQENQGFCLAINRAISISTGDYVAVVGAGDEVFPDKFSDQLVFLNDNPSIGIVGTGYEVVNAHSGDKVSETSTFDADINTETLQKKVPFTHGTVMYRREVIKELCGYDCFFRYSQDWDLYCRAIKFVKIGAVPRVLYRKYIFSDGFSYQPSHAIRQSFYANLAKNQNRELIDYYKNSPDKLKLEVDPCSITKLPYSIRRLAGCLVNKNWEMSKLWIIQILKQIKIIK
ncbi:glycosyltransferase family 2 protein [Idiomarina loihiensis]|uniref:glycosyltransferase family 2 protein n=1 Tax=Idiomarina loihiensis TaxID=135577 RepID=UPI00384B5633